MARKEAVCLICGDSIFLVSNLTWALPDGRAFSLPVKNYHCVPCQKDYVAWDETGPLNLQVATQTAGKELIRAGVAEAKARLVEQGVGLC